MVSSLKRLFVPVLRERGFRGSLPHFRRPMKERIDLLTVQFDKWGGGFVIEISNCVPDGLTTQWGQHVAPNRVRAWDVYPPNRRRLGSSQPGGDGHWFRFDEGTPTHEVAQLAVSYLREAEQRWATAGQGWSVN